MSGKPDLILPVYLNQRVVFDLVAMLQGGIATVTRVAESERDSANSSGELTGGFGLSQALSSLLKVNLSGKLTAQEEGSIERSSSAERVHTPASLLFTLRNLLVETGALRALAVRDPIGPGDFVEFTAALNRNPLIEGLDSVVEILDLLLVFADTGASHKAGKKAPAQGDYKRLRGQLSTMSTSLKAGGTQDLVADLHSGWRAVLTVEEQFLNDPTLSDLVDGTFRVVGKVIRSVDTPEGSINLLRKTAMSRVPPAMLEALIGAFSSLQLEHGFTMPTMEMTIQGPVIQVLPLAIFS